MRVRTRLLLGTLIGLVLALGMIPGMSLTAYAAEKSETISLIGDGENKTATGTHFKVTCGYMFLDDFGLSINKFGAMTVSSLDGTVMTKVVWTYYNGNKKNTISVSPGTFNGNNTVTGINSTNLTVSSTDSAGVKLNSITIYYGVSDIDVTDVTLSPNTEQTIDAGDKVSFTAAVAPNDATNKKVKWSVNNSNVALYSNEACITPVGTDATDTLTVYAKGVSAGSATITVTATNGTEDTADDQSASCAVTVNKADPTAPTGLTATYGQKLSDVALPTGWTWADSTQSVGSVVSPAATFKANFAGDDNYNAASNVDVTVTVSKADATTAMQVASVSIAGTSGKTATVSYTLPDGASYGAVTNSNTEFFTVDTTSGIVLTAAKNWTAPDWATDTSKTFTVLVSGATNYNDYTLTVTVTPTYKATQTITAADVTATYGDTNAKIEATTTSGGGTLSYMVKSGDAVTVDASGNLTINKAGSAVITVTAAETDTYAQATQDVNVTVNTKTMTVSAEDVNVTVDGQPHGITVTVTDPASGATVKYGTEEGSYTLDASPTQTEVGEKTVYYQVTADNYTTYTGSAKVTVSAKQTQTITAENVTAAYGDTGKSIKASTSGDGTLSYAVKSGDAVTVNETTGALTIVKAGSAVITVTASETATYTQATKEVTVTINKANAVAATVTANNRTYDETAQPLVTVSGEATGGTMQYALGENSTTAPADNLYTTSIPTATEAGTYTVWYKVVGDANHNNSEPQKVAATIAKPADAVALTGSGHVQNVGDVVGKASGKGVKVGTEGRSLRLENFALALPKDVEGGIEYRGHVQNQGWGGWVAGGKSCGTAHRSLRVEAAQVRLTGALAKTHSVWYRVHAQNFGTLGWARDGQAAGTAGQGLRLESIEVQVLPQGQVPEGYVDRQASYVGAVSANVHLQDRGWTGSKSALEFGTTGRGRRLEAVRLSAPATPVPAGVSYEAHVQNVGWQGARSAGGVAGTTGRSLRIEAVRISLTGEAAKEGNYSVWYRVHSQDYGWLGWAHDGAEAGTTGLAKRAEAIDVQVLPQGQVPKGYNASRAACVRR